MTDLQKAQVALLVRAFLKVCGGALVAKGFSADVNDWTTLIEIGVGAGQILFALIWSNENKKKVAPAVEMAKQVEEGTAFITRAEVEAENRGYEDELKKP